MSAYRTLTRTLTNMHASERTAFDASDSYNYTLSLVSAGRDAEAIAMAQQFRTSEGDDWRARAFDAGLISTADFVN